MGLDLYGHQLYFSADFPKLSTTNQVDKELIQSDLNRFQMAFTNDLLDDLNQYSEEFLMDDMAFLMMSKKLAHSVYENENQANVFLYHILKLKNYDVILGYSNCQTTVYGQLGFKVFNAIEVNLAFKTYTDLTFSQKKNPLTEEIFEKPASLGRAILINENRPPQFNAKSKKYKLYFEFEQFPYYFTGKLNESLVAYYNDLPDIMFSDIYLNYQVSESVKSSLLKELSDVVSDLNEEKKLAFLLKFSQDAIPYKDDMTAQGKEKFSFPEESLANPYGDCEDKSILFAYLAKELLNKTSLALVYFQQHHLNVAIETKGKENYNFSFKDKKYLVCEPSGNGFKPGDNSYDLTKASIVSW
ncbi:MAG: hypothetical protein ACOVP1_14390 [Bacteroidia bacterium]